MTIEIIEGQEAIDFDAIDDHYEAIRHIVGHDWLKGDEDLERFVRALYESRRGPLDLISQNDVRRRLLEETAKGPRCSIEHHRYSALFSRARAEGIIRRHQVDGRTVKDVCTTSPTGNNGKDQVVYQWVGGGRG